jgi:hypothetical protein
MDEGSGAQRRLARSCSKAGRIRNVVPRAFRPPLGDITPGLRLLLGTFLGALYRPHISSPPRGPPSEHRSRPGLLGRPAGLGPCRLIGWRSAQQDDAGRCDCQVPAPSHGGLAGRPGRTAPRWEVTATKADFHARRPGSCSCHAFPALACRGVRRRRVRHGDSGSAVIGVRFRRPAVPSCRVPVGALMVAGLLLPPAVTARRPAGDDPITGIPALREVSAVLVGGLQRPSEGW